MPSNSLPANLASFVSVIDRIPDTVAAEEAEIPGISKPVIRCGPQHPEVGIPVGKPQAFACYDPSGKHLINDNEHVGASGRYEWEFRNLPEWLTAHTDGAGKLDGILYGTPLAPGEWYAEGRVHNLDDEYGVFSDWTPIRLLVTPGSEYLPISAQFAVGTPVAYPLEGTGPCDLTGAPAWVEVKQVPNGCILIGKAPLSGEYYYFEMPGFRQAGYPDISLVFSGKVVGGYGFVPLPVGVGLSGLNWHQVEKYADPSTETPVLSLEYIGVEPFTGQLYRILPPPGKPQPPNERPAETAITIDVVSAEGPPLIASLTAARADIAAALTANPSLKVRFGNLAVEADRDIYVTAGQISDPTGVDPTVIPIGGPTIANGAVMKVRGSTISTISLPGVQAYYLDLDSDLRPAIIGVEKGQVDKGSLLATGTTTGNVAVVNTDTMTGVQLVVDGASSLGSVSVDFGTRWAYVAAPLLQNVAVFGPTGTRPPMEPRIWSSEEITWNRGFETIAGGPFKVMATGDLPMTLSLLGELPAGINFVDNGDGTATISGVAGPETEGDYAFALTATNAAGIYAQAIGMSVNTPPAITSGNAATFTVDSASSFTITGTGYPTPIFFTWDESALPKGVELVDNENGTASLVGTPETAGTYPFTLYATTGCDPDASQAFTVTVNPAGTQAPVITSPNTALFDTVGAEFSPDPFTVTALGSPTPTLSIVTEAGQTGLPLGVNFIDNGNSTGTLGAGCQVLWPGMDPSCLMALFNGTEGTYTFTIKAENTQGSTSQAFTLVLATATSIMTPPPTAPATLSFDYAYGGTMPPPQIFTVGTLGDTMPYAAVTTANWLVATPVSGTVPGNLNVAVEVIPSGLTAGTYTGTVLVTSAGTDGPFATALVTLTVSEYPLTSITPSLLSFAYAASDRTVPSQNVSVTTGGVPLQYRVSTDAAWLAATPLNGTTPGSVNVSVNKVSTLPMGTYTGTVTIDSFGAVNGPQKLMVTLIKTAKKLNISVNAATVGSGPEGIALNTKTHLLFINASNGAGGEPANSDEAAVVETPDPAAGSAVLRFNPSTGMVDGGTLVHSEGEYVAVNSKTGRVYHASQGTAEIAVIDGLANTIVGYIPLTFDNGAWMPYQIAVDEARNIIYVGAKAPPITPDPTPVPGQPFTCKAIHEMPDDEYDCWNPGSVFVIDGDTNQIVDHFLAGDDPEGVVFAAATCKVYASNEDDGSMTVAECAKRDANGSIKIPDQWVLYTIIRGNPVPGWWQPTCDANNYCGERGQAALWPERSACNGLDDEAEEADKMAVDKDGNVYIIDDRYRVAKINGKTYKVDNVLGLEGFDCELEVPDGSNVVFRNTANNIAYSSRGTGYLYVTSEQDTISVIDPVFMTLQHIITVPGAGELDAITIDPGNNSDSVYVTDEELGALWMLQVK